VADPIAQWQCLKYLTKQLSRPSWEGSRTMFEQIDDPEDGKTRKEWLAEAAIILAVVAVVLGGLFYVLY